MPHQQFQRFFVTPDLMQLQRQLHRQFDVVRLLLHLLLQLLDFRRVRRLLQQFNLRHQALIAGIAILQRDGRQHSFGIFAAAEGDLGFGQRQTDVAALLAALPGVFQQRQRFGGVAGGQQFLRLRQFQIFFLRQETLQQVADRFFRLRALEAIDRLTVFKQVDRRNRTQPELGGDHLFGVAVHLGQNELTGVFRRQLVQHRRELQAVLAALGPEVEQHRNGHRLFQRLVQVSFVNINNSLS